MEFTASVVEKFNSKVDVRGPDECWKWKGKPSKQGYGRFCHDSEVVNAHRASLTIAKGPIPSGMFACHTCDNRMCVNPAHLWAGTSQQNHADMMAKGRARGPGHRGSKVGTSKLKEADVQIVIAMLGRGLRPASIARWFDVTPQAISRIKSGFNWRWMRDGEHIAHTARHTAGGLS